MFTSRHDERWHSALRPLYLDQKFILRSLESPRPQIVAALLSFPLFVDSAVTVLPQMALRSSDCGVFDDAICRWVTETSAAPRKPLPWNLRVAELAKNPVSDRRILSAPRIRVIWAARVQDRCTTESVSRDLKLRPPFYRNDAGIRQARGDVVNIQVTVCCALKAAIRLVLGSIRVFRFEPSVRVVRDRNEPPRSVQRRYENHGPAVSRLRLGRAILITARGT